MKRKTSKKRLIELCEAKILEELKEERGARCEICGGINQLGLFHVLPKGVYYNFRLHKENLLIAGWFCCHLPWHHSYYEARDRIVPKIKELLGEDYEVRLKQLADNAPKLNEVRLMEILEE